MFLETIKCHTCGRNAKLISSGLECNTDRQYEDFQCGKGHITRLYMDEMGNQSLCSVRIEEWFDNNNINS
jgi:hypothetical protein